MAARRSTGAKTTKKRAGSKAVAKRSKGGLLSIKDAASELGGPVDRDQTDMGAEGNFISTKGGVFHVGDESAEVIEGFVIDHVIVNLFYEGVYNAKDPQGATCYAISRELDSIAPPPNLPTRVRDACSVCPNDVFGSAVVGDGKACKNTYRLLFVPVHHAEDGFENPDVYVLSVPAASIKSYRKHHKGLERQGITKTWAISTEISISPGESGGHVLDFNAIGAVTGDKASRLDELARKSTADLFAAPKLVDADAPKKGGSKPRKPAAKGARKKRA